MLEEMALRLISDLRRGDPPSRLTALGYDFDVAEAYRVQQRVIDIRYPSAVHEGYKAGLTSSGSPARFGLSEPVAAVLPVGSRLLADGDGLFSLSIADYVRPMVEIELGFLLSRDITDPDISIAELKDTISAVYPVLELPDLGFVGGSPHGLDVIAANVAARYYLRSEEALPESTDLVTLPVTLIYNGETCMHGIGGDAMGNPWLALQWLVRQRMDSGWPLRQGQLLITGALGKMMPVAQGLYRAEFGEHVALTLRVRRD